MDFQITEAEEEESVVFKGPPFFIRDKDGALYRKGNYDKEYFKALCRGERLMVIEMLFSYYLWNFSITIILFSIETKFSNENNKLICAFRKHFTFSQMILHKTNILLGNEQFICSWTLFQIQFTA